MDRIPLASVRTFAVVARLMSISRAAEELSVTPSAVSHQIRVLEEYLGTPLFRRENNKIRLTPAGQQYLSQVSEGLFLLVRATQTIRGAKGQQVLRIAAPPSITYLWLMPRLARFMKAYPETPLSVTIVPDPPPLLQGLFDVGFSYGEAGAAAGLHAEPLGPNLMFPICKPSQTQGERALRQPADLAHCTLLESTDEAYYQTAEPRQPRWEQWLRAAGVPELTPARYLNLTPRLLVYRAVVAGLGVGLARGLIATDGLAAKELAVPFGPVLAQTSTYNLMYPSNLGRRRDVAAFRNWALAEAATSAKTIQRLLKRVAGR